jgi:putative spermidine/putrescine transport system permease protein
MMTLENMLLNNKIGSRLGIFCFMLLVALPFAGSLVYAILYSFGLTGILSKGFTAVHVSGLLQNREILFSLLYSLYIAVCSMLISLILAICGVLFFKTAITKSKWSFFPYLPLALPAIVTAFISLQVLNKTGVLSRVLYQTSMINDLSQFPDMVNDKLGIGIIITHVLMATPFFLIFFSNIYETENLKALSNVAKSLGASSAKVAEKIVIPLLLKKGLHTILLYFIFVFGSYEIPLILGQQSPQMISVLIVRKMQRYNLMDIPQGYFLSLVYSIVVIVLLAVFFKSKKQRIV